MTEAEQIQFLVEFQEWCNKIAQDNPMQFETDLDDIAMMFIESKKHSK